MDAAQIKSFIDAMASSDLAEIEFSQDGWTLRLVRTPATAPAVASVAAAPRRGAVAGPGANVPAASSREVLAPLFGVVHLQPSPGSEPFAVAGQAVRAGQTLCVIEAMKVFNQVLAEEDGVVDAVLVASGAEVEAGQPLLRLR